jgi:hypothetical protein
MLKSGNKFRALRDIIFFLTRVLSEIFFLNETNNHKVKWSVPKLNGRALKKAERY